MKHGPLAHEGCYRNILCEVKLHRNVPYCIRKDLSVTIALLHRYPTFVDALRDLDDALTMVHLFATLPAEHRFKIPNAIVQTSRRLALEWQAYVVRTSSLRKTFISVKGFYFQADIMGQTVTWLVPHQLSQASFTI